jgi:hypothetical protein
MAEATIPSGTDVSNVVNLADDEIVGVIFPVLTSANITFLVANDLNDTFVEVYKSDLSGSYVLPSTTGSLAVWMPELAPFRLVKVKSSVNQAAERTIEFLTRKGS